jgi:hypothetical protein
MMIVSKFNEMMKVLLLSTSKEMWKKSMNLLFLVILYYYVIASELSDCLKNSSYNYDEIKSTYAVAIFRDFPDMMKIKFSMCENEN